jgi:hypothetical protein
MRPMAPLFLVSLCAFAQNQVSPERAAGMKADLVGQIDAMKKQAQVMVDTVFSFGELGFQEVETSRYLTALLEKEGFKSMGWRGYRRRLWPRGGGESNGAGLGRVFL